MNRPVRSAALLTVAGLMGGCVVGTVASTAVSVTATAVETTADIVGGTVDLIIPGGDDDD